MNTPEDLLNEVYRKSSSFVTAGVNSYEHKIVKYFAENGNNNQDIISIMTALNISISDKEKVMKAIERMNNDGTLLYIHKINNNARTIKEKTMMTTYYLDDRVIKVFTALCDIAVAENNYRKTVKTKEIIEFNKKLQIFIKTLINIYNGDSVDLSPLKEDESTSLYEYLFEEDGLYDKIKNGVFGFNQTVSKLRNDIDIIEKDKDIFGLLEDYRIGVDDVFYFVEDFLNELPPYISAIKKSFKEIKDIHENYILDKFYQPVHESISAINKINIKEEEGKIGICQRINYIVSNELDKKGKILVLGDEMRNVTKSMREVTDKIMKFQTIKRNQKKFQQMAKEFYSIDNKNDLKLTFDYYFSTKVVEHFSINGDYSIDGDSINYELAPSRKYKPAKRKIVKKGLTEEEKELKNKIALKKKEEETQKSEFIKELFPDNKLRKNTFYSDKELDFILSIYFIATSDAHYREVDYSFNKNINMAEYEKYVFYFKHTKGGKTIWESNKQRIIISNTVDMEVFLRHGQQQKRN